MCTTAIITGAICLISGIAIGYLLGKKNSCKKEEPKKEEDDTALYLGRIIVSMR